MALQSTVWTGTLLILFALYGCATHRSPTLNTSSGDLRWQKGVASWYGHPFHGRKTANGEIYDMYKLTAAHRTAPLGSFALVVNEANGRKVTVYVNDRGPFVKDRIVDLSYAAAKELGFVDQGTTPVRLALMDKQGIPLGRQHVRYYLQFAAFDQKRHADNFAQRFRQRHGQVRLQVYVSPRKPVVYRVQSQAHQERSEAEAMATELGLSDHEYFVVER